MRLRAIATAIALAAACWSAAAAHAADNGGAKPPEKKADKKRAKKADRGKAPKRLGRTVKIDFDLVPEEDDAKPLSVLCATRKYAMEAEVKGRDGGFQWLIEGEVIPTQDNRRILLTFSARLAYENADWKSKVRAVGSAVVKIGEKATIAELGDKSLVVLISPDPNRKKKVGDKKGNRKGGAKGDGGKKDDRGPAGGAPRPPDDPAF